MFTPSISTVMNGIFRQIRGFFSTGAVAVAVADAVGVATADWVSSHPNAVRTRRNGIPRRCIGIARGA
jgi:hypothetical protein